MKKFIVASKETTTMYNKAEKILKASKDLLNLLEDTPEGFIDNNDLEDVYDSLIEAIPAFQMAIKSKGLEF